jgi:hypothetical protein
MEHGKVEIGAETRAVAVMCITRADARWNVNWPALVVTIQISVPTVLFRGGRFQAGTDLTPGKPNRENKISQIKVCERLVSRDALQLLSWTSRSVEMPGGMETESTC